MVQDMAGRTPAQECAPLPVAITSLKRPPVPVSAPEKGATPLSRDTRWKNKKQGDRMGEKMDT